MYSKCISNTHKVINMTALISARIELTEYANKVLNMLKIKFGLRDKSEALNKFVDLYGEEVVEKEATEIYAKKVIALANKHFQKYGSRKMTLKELDQLCGVN